MDMSTFENLVGLIREEVRSVLGREPTDEETPSYGLFIKLPEELAEQFPAKPEEPSPPHVTFLYIGIGPTDEEGKGHMFDVLRQEIGDMEPFKAKLDGLGYFKSVNQEDGKVNDRIVPHVKVSFEPEKRQWKGYLWTVLEKAGIDITDSFPNFQPHVTLGYVTDVPHSYKWEGDVPEGEFDVMEIEFWAGDGEVVETFQVGTNDST